MYMDVHKSNKIFNGLTFSIDRITLLENFIHIPTKYQQKDHMSVNSTYMILSVTFLFKLPFKNLCYL